MCYAETGAVPVTCLELVLATHSFDDSVVGVAGRAAAAAPSTKDDTVCSVTDSPSVCSISSKSPGLSLEGPSSAIDDAAMSWYVRRTRLNSAK